MISPAAASIGQIRPGRLPTRVGKPMATVDDNWYALIKRPDGNTQKVPTSRHYYASVLLDGGESIKTASERLGHADPAFTLRTYTHLLPSSESRTKEIIEAALPALPRCPGSRSLPQMCHDLRDDVHSCRSARYILLYYDV